MNSAAEKHLDKATAFIAVAESGDAKLAAYRQAADEIIAAQQADPKLSQREIERRLHKWNGWASTLLRWRRVGDPLHPPFGGPDEVARKTRESERREPTRHEDRVAMATKLLADPEVAKAAMPSLLAKPSAARRQIEQAVSRRTAEERKRQVEEANRKRDATAAPLPAYMSRMVVKMNEWAAGLASIEPDLDTLPDGRGREMVLDALGELARQAQRCIDRLTASPDADVIEGRAA